MVAEKRFADAARLRGFIEVLRADISLALSPQDQAGYDALIQQVRSQLPDEEFAKLADAGKKASLAELLSLTEAQAT